MNIETRTNKNDSAWNFVFLVAGFTSLVFIGFFWFDLYKLFELVYQTPARQPLITGNAALGVKCDPVVHWWVLGALFSGTAVLCLGIAGLIPQGYKRFPAILSLLLLVYYSSQRL